MSRKVGWTRPEKCQGREADYPTDRLSSDLLALTPVIRPRPCLEKKILPFWRKPVWPLTLDL
jgi:hypothetical protein